MFCPKCGTQLPDGASFCGTCGSALSNAPKHGRPAHAQAPVQQSGYAAPPAYGGSSQPTAQNPYANRPVSVAPVSPASPAASRAFGTMGDQRFINARRGIKTLYQAQALMFISAGITLVLGLLSVGAGYAGANDLATGMLGATGIASIALVVISVIAFIMRLVGLFRASKDEKSFLGAFIVTLVGLGCSIMTVVLAYMAVRNYDSSMIGTINTISTVSTYITLAIYVLIFFAVMMLAKKMGRSNVATTALVMLFIAAIAYLVATFLPISSVLFYVIRLVCAFLPEILLLIIFAKANKMFA